MAWRLVQSLIVLRTQVRAAAPRAVPPATPATSWGTVGDTRHESTSDHSPHVYPLLGEVVCAADFPHAPALGLDGARFTEALRGSRDRRIGYVIFNRRIFSGHQVGDVPAYTWRPYSGSDPHDTHWHVSTVHTARADEGWPWTMPGTTTTAGGTMPYDATPNNTRRLEAVAELRPQVELFTDGTGTKDPVKFPMPITDAIGKLQTSIDNVANLITGLDLPVITGAGLTETQVRFIVRSEVRSAVADIGRAVSAWLAGEPIPPVGL